MTSKLDRKEAARQFRERKPVPGIYEHRCTLTGRFWVDSSPNVAAAHNGQLFQFRQRLHRNKDLQAEWNTYGEQAFEFNILETLPDDTPSMLVSDLLLERKRFWSNRP